MYKNLPAALKEEIKESILLLKDEKNHQQLKVHKLKGFSHTYSYSVNYKIRVIFEYGDKKAINILYVGDHDSVY